MSIDIPSVPFSIPTTEISSLPSVPVDTVNQVALVENSGFLQTHSLPDGYEAAFKHIENLPVGAVTLTSGSRSDFCCQLNRTATETSSLMKFIRTRQNWLADWV